MWHIRKVPVEVISINFGWEQPGQTSNFLITSRPRIEKAGAAIDPEKDSAEFRR